MIRSEHAALAAVLRAMSMIIERGPEPQAQHFFDALRAMLFYLDEFPERHHHPNESDHLFPRLARLAPELMPVIRRLENDHANGESRVRQLQHLLAGWEFIGASRRQAFVEAARDYERFYLEHMRIEETQLLPVAAKLFAEDDWKELDAACAASLDPLAGGQRDPSYDALFSRIVLKTPAPFGVGGI